LLSLSWRLASITPGSAHSSPLPAESYLTAELAAAFREATGIAGRLYDWQAECLSTPGVLQVGVVLRLHPS
jgi:hypothetical protein